MKGEGGGGSDGKNAGNFWVNEEDLDLLLLLPSFGVMGDGERTLRIRVTIGWMRKIFTSLLLRIHTLVLPLSHRTRLSAFR